MEMKRKQEIKKKRKANINRDLAEWRKLAEKVSGDFCEKADRDTDFSELVKWVIEAEHDHKTGVYALFFILK